MEFRPDWCISRQRAWGVPIVAFYCSDCGEVLANDTVTDHVAAIFERETSDAWFALSASELVPPGARCGRCGGAGFRKEEDILDVWFDSGVSHEAVLEARSELGWPADLYLEGSDQHRGWFHSSLLSSIVTRGRAPFESVLTHGFTMDANGRKMSKSLGNTIEPQELIDKHGAEILRLWVAAEDYRDDQRISNEIIGRTVEAYRRIRNTARFLIANLYDFEPARHGVKPSELAELDRWIIDRTRRLVMRCREAYLAYEFHVVVHALNNFCSVDLSALYLDIVKDRLYCSATGDPRRRAAQTALADILEQMTRVMAPILTFTADEVWGYLPKRPNREDDVFLADFPNVTSDDLDDELANTWDRLLEVRTAVTKALEEERKNGRIGHSLDAALRLGVRHDGELASLLSTRLAELPTFFIVSQVAFDEGLSDTLASPILPDLRIVVEPASGAKCARCWNYRTDVGRIADHPTICGRCATAVTS
jgi:isoleucyl-tRNA synthetase